MGYDEEGEEYVPETEMNTQRRMEEEKPKQRIPEEEYFHKLDMADSNKKFDFVMEDFRDFLYNVPGRDYMLAVLDGRAEGKTFKQIGLEMKPKPLSDVTMGKYARKLADQFIEYAKFVEDDWLYQLALSYKNSVYKKAALSFDTDMGEEALNSAEVQLEQKALDSLLDGLRNGIEQVDMENLVENTSMPADRVEQILGLEKGVLSSRRIAAVDPMAQMMFIMQDIVDYLDKKDPSKKMSELFIEIGTGKTLLSLQSKYKDIDTLMDSLVSSLKEYAEKSQDNELKSLAEYLDTLKTASLYNGAEETTGTEDGYSAVTKFCDALEKGISKIDVKKVVKGIERPSMKLLNMFGISKQTTGVIDSIVDMFTGSRKASMQVKRCSLENILSESEVVDASFDESTPLAQKKALDQSIYESMVKEYEDIIEEDDSLYGLKVSSDSTAQNKEDVLPKNVDLDEKIRVEKNPLINLDGEGYSSARKATDFVYESEDDSQTVPWF